MEEKGKYGSHWIEGFTKAAMANGANNEDTKALLKVAAILDKLSEPDFVEGFRKQAKALGVEPETLMNGVLIKEAGLMDFMKAKRSFSLNPKNIWAGLKSGWGTPAAKGLADTATDTAAKRLSLTIPLDTAGKFMWNPLTVGLGVYGAGRIQPWMERNIGRDEYGRQIYDVMQLANEGKIPQVVAAQMMRDTIGNRARGDLSTLGFNDNTRRRSPYDSWFGE